MRRRTMSAAERNSHAQEAEVIADFYRDVHGVPPTPAPVGNQGNSARRERLNRERPGAVLALSRATDASARAYWERRLAFIDADLAALDVHTEQSR